MPLRNLIERSRVHDAAQCMLAAPCFIAHRPCRHHARAFAEDVVRVQPDGPYLLGGHSYGGAVAVEIALVLESWGRHVALVMVRAKG